MSAREVESITIVELIKDMVGEGVNLYPCRKANPGGKILEVRNFSREPILKNIQFSLRKGEILGIAGLKGSGRTELARSLSGLDGYDRGEISL